MNTKPVVLIESLPDCQQESQGAAQLESSGNSWELPVLGAGGSLEEQDIRLPPLSHGTCFNDEYEVSDCPCRVYSCHSSGMVASDAGCVLLLYESKHQEYTVSLSMLVPLHFCSVLAV